MSQRFISFNVCIYFNCLGNSYQKTKHHLKLVALTKKRLKNKLKSKKTYRAETYLLTGKQVRWVKTVKYKEGRAGYHSRVQGRMGGLPQLCPREGGWANTVVSKGGWVGYHSCVEGRVGGLPQSCPREGGWAIKNPFQKVLVDPVKL